MVGCVSSHDDQIIGEGYHQKYGEAHAEGSMPINAVGKINLFAFENATVYVTLGALCHWGKLLLVANLLV